MVSTEIPLRTHSYSDGKIRRALHIIMQYNTALRASVWCYFVKLASVVHEWRAAVLRVCIHNSNYTCLKSPEKQERIHQSCCSRPRRRERARSSQSFLLEEAADPHRNGQSRESPHRHRHAPRRSRSDSCGRAPDWAVRSCRVTKESEKSSALSLILTFFDW